MTWFLLFVTFLLIVVVAYQTSYLNRNTDDIELLRQQVERLQGQMREMYHE
jgi:hypothetical protein